MVSKIIIRLKLSPLFILLFFFLTPPSFAELSEVDRWNYIKSLVEDRFKFSQNLISEIATETDTEESLMEKYNLIASLTGENYPFLQGLIHQSEAEGDTSRSLALLPAVILKIIRYDLVPWHSFSDRIAEGESSFKSPQMQDKLAKINHSLTDLAIHFPEKIATKAVDLAMVMTLYLRVNHQISKVQKIEKKEKKQRNTDLLQEKILLALEEEIVQHNFSFLKILRNHLFELLDTSQRQYLSTFKKSDLLDISVFQSTMKKTTSSAGKYKKTVQNLRKEVFSLYKRVKFKLTKKSKENSNLKNLLRSELEVDEKRIIESIYYFEKIFLPLLVKKSMFFDVSISEKLNRLNDKLFIFSKKSTILDRISIFDQIIVDVCNIHRGLPKTFNDFINGKKIYFDSLNSISEDFLTNEVAVQDMLDFSSYIRAKIIPFFFLINHELEGLESEAELLMREIKDLKRTIKNLYSHHKSSKHAIIEEEFTSSFESKEDTTSQRVSEKDECHSASAQGAPTDKEGIKIELEELLTISQDLASQGKVAMKEVTELAERPTDMESLEKEATIFNQAVEDEYKIYIQNKIKGRHRDLLESIYSSQAPGIRFETFQSLIERCGGILKFDGRGSSHFHMVLPGGHTGRSWRLHGGAHSLKIQRQALDGFRKALTGVANILKINHLDRRPSV